MLVVAAEEGEAIESLVELVAVSSEFDTPDVIACTTTTSTTTTIKIYPLDNLDFTSMKAIRRCLYVVITLDQRCLPVTHCW